MPRVQQTALGLLAALAIACPAAAQEPGVTIDPSSPSAKQYVLPLDNARRQAEPKRGSSSARRGSSSPQLFGAGVGDSGGGGGGGGSAGPDASPSGRSGPKGSGSSRGRTPAATTGSARLPEQVRAAITSPGAPDGGIGTTAIGIGIGVAVLLAGVGIGVVARRRAA